MSTRAIGRYRLEKQLGKGSMGEVFRAFDPELDRRVAIKTIRLDSPVFEDDRETVLARFQTEARAAARLVHPNIVTVFDFGAEQGLYYLVMEYVEGDTLARRLSGGALPPGEAATIALQTCDALGAAHEAGIVHRDIKPANLMIDRSSGLVKVMDFGIARIEVGTGTQPGIVVGTPRYMSPEQIRGRPVDHRSDLFSLGAVYAETLTGKLLFDGTDMTVISHQILNEEPKLVGRIEAELGEEVGWVLRRALAKEPERRFQSAAEFREAVERHCVPRGRTKGKLPRWSSSREAAAASVPPSPPPPPATAPAAPAPPSPSEPVRPTGTQPPTDPLSRSDPVFTAPRRSRGPGKALVVTSLVTVVAMGAAVGAWLKFGGGMPGDGARLAPPPTVDGEGPVAADTPEVATPEPELPPTPAPVRLAITVEPGAATVFVNDTLVVGPDGVLMPPGPHTVHAESEGYLPLDTLVELSGDTALSLVLARAPPETGTVTVQANVPGRVQIDGRDRGAAPLRGVELLPGSHTVRFVPDGARALAEERSVRVTARETARASFEVLDALLSVGVREPRWATVYAGETRLGDTPLIERRLPARVYQVRVEREGYVPVERLIRLEPGEHVEWLDVVLDESER